LENAVAASGILQNRLRSGFFALLVCGTLIARSSFATDSSTEMLAAEARKAAGRLLQHIRAEVSAEIDRSGPIRAVTVCKFSAPELSSAISRQTGMRVTRVSLHPRNAFAGSADTWEQKNLLEFEKRLIKGEKIDELETFQIVSEPAGRYFRYIKAIPMGQPCVVCHGTEESIPQGVKAMLASDYPFDPARNLKPGQLRGAVSVKKPIGN
jgi:Protein of unknown function (DUF3365)